MNIIKGNLIELALQSKFDVICHGCNCFCKQKSGIAKQMVEKFGTDRFALEKEKHIGNYNKLGTIDYEQISLEIINNTWSSINKFLTVVNCYSQYDYGREKNVKYVDYDALRLCLRKINFTFRGDSIGLPRIGCGLAGGDWEVVKKIIEEELTDMNATVVELN
jgi:O-acetyl-ADP-ribose deacetylase (regulator of RNase III)